MSLLSQAHPLTADDCPGTRVEAFIADAFVNLAGAPSHVSETEAFEALREAIGLGSAAPGVFDLVRSLRAGTLDSAIWPSLANLPASRAEGVIAAAIIEIDLDLELRCDLLRGFGDGPARTVNDLAVLVNQSHLEPLRADEVMEQPFGRGSLAWEIASALDRIDGLAPPGGRDGVHSSPDTGIAEPLIQLLAAFRGAHRSFAGRKRHWAYRQAPPAAFERLVQLIGGGAVPEGSSNDPEGMGILSSPQALAAPFIPRPVHACAEAVLVEGCLNRAMVHVLSGGSSIGSSECVFGLARVALDRPLVKYEHITALQIVDGTTSDPSPIRIVEELQEGIRPAQIDDVYVCAIGTGAWRVTPGLFLSAEHCTWGRHCLTDSLFWSPYGGGWPVDGHRDRWFYLAHDSHAQISKAWVRMRQTYCPGTNDEVLGPYSEYRLVSPTPTTPLNVIKRIGTEQLVVTGALVGGWGGFAIDGVLHDIEGNYFENMLLDAGTPLEDTAEIEAWQELCDVSDTASVHSVSIQELQLRLEAPEVSPICWGAREIHVRASEDGGMIELFSYGSGTTVTTAGRTRGVTLSVPSSFTEDYIEATHVFPHSGVTSPTGVAPFERRLFGRLHQPEMATLVTFPA